MEHSLCKAMLGSAIHHITSQSDPKDIESLFWTLLFECGDSTENANGSVHCSAWGESSLNMSFLLFSESLAVRTRIAGIHEACVASDCWAEVDFSIGVADSNMRWE